MTENQEKRKKSGEFYTPSFVVDYMIEKTFNHLTKKKKIEYSSLEGFQNSLSKITFCDLSLGTGNFLIGILKWISKKLRNFSEIENHEQKSYLRSFVRSNFFGVEINELALTQCKKIILENYPFIKKTDLRNLRNGNSVVDLDAFEIMKEEQASILQPFSWEKAFAKKNRFDVILGNPPYFNLKKMLLKDESIQFLYEYLKKSEKWRQYFRSSSDIYYYFLIKAVSLLNENGILSFIMPNYWIENKYADKLRSLLLENQIQEIINLGEMNVFKDDGRWLNVSTCIFILEKTFPYRDISITKKVPRNFFSKTKTKPKATRFKVDQTLLDEKKWVLSPHISIIKEIESNDEYVPLSSVAKVAQGLSPGVKSVFVISEKKKVELGLELDVLVPFVSNKNIKRWKLNIDTKMYSILPSRIEELSKYENIKKYLQKHKKQLMMGPDRKRLLSRNKIRWFDFSVYRNLDLFENTDTKILCPYRGLYPRFSLDKEGYFGATDTYAIVAENEDDFYSLLGILNSDVVNFWYKEAGKRKGNMLEFFSDPLNNLPVPTMKERKKIIGDTRVILTELESTSNKKSEKIIKYENELNSKVAEMYGLDYNFLIDYLNKNK